MDLAVNPGLTHTARNQLRVLGAEIQDQDLIFVYVFHFLIYSPQRRKGRKVNFMLSPY
jgi:hypothetical protein